MHCIFSSLCVCFVLQSLIIIRQVFLIVFPHPKPKRKALTFQLQQQLLKNGMKFYLYMSDTQAEVCQDSAQFCTILFPRRDQTTSEKAPEIPALVRFSYLRQTLRPPFLESSVTSRLPQRSLSRQPQLRRHLLGENLLKAHHGGERTTCKSAGSSSHSCRPQHPGHNAALCRHINQAAQGTHSLQPFKIQ